MGILKTTTKISAFVPLIALLLRKEYNKKSGHDDEMKHAQADKSKTVNTNKIPIDDTKNDTKTIDEPNKDERNDLIEKLCLGLLYGLSIGDALGIPYENLTEQEIIDLREKRSDNLKLYPRVPETHRGIPDGWKTGRWTDDTQLSIAIMKILIKMNDINKKIHKKKKKKKNKNVDWVGLLHKDVTKIIEEEHVKQYKISTHGWGGGTRSAIARLDKKTHNYKTSGNNNSCGNGVLMKLSPLAFYYIHQKLRIMNEQDEKDSHVYTLNDSEVKEIEALTRMTHNNRMCVIASLIHAELLQHVFSKHLEPKYFSPLPKRKEYLQLCYDTAIKYEKLFIKEFIQEEKDELKRRMGDNELDLISKRFKYLLDNWDDKNKKMPITNEHIIKASHGGTSFAWDSIVMVHGLFVQKKPAFKSIERATRIGGDTDSNASMIGSMVGGFFGNDKIKEVYVRPLYENNALKKLAIQFSKIFQGQHHKL